MTLPPLPLTDGRLLIDNSFLETFVCPRRTQYNRLSKRILSAATPALNFGTSCHKALEHRYKECLANSPDSITESAQCSILTEFFAANPPPDGDRRDLNFAVELFITRYNRRYPSEPFSILTDDKDAALIELPFALPIGAVHISDKTLPSSLEIWYSGRIDLPVLWDNQVVVIDHKTTSFLGPQFFEEMKMSPQPEGYCYAFEKLTGKPVNGYCINAIRTAAKPIYVQKWEEKRKSILDDYSDLPGPSITADVADRVYSSALGAKERKLDPAKWWEEAYARDRTFLRPGQLDDWHQNTMALVETFLWHYQRDYLPMMKKECIGKYGKCQYYEVCSLSKEQRETILNSGMFTDNNWTPLNPVKA